MSRFLSILRFFCAYLVFLNILSTPLRAQNADAALLVANSVLITEDERLIATGNVEAFYEGTRLFTEEIIYDQTRDELIIKGEVRISQENGDVIIADSADLDSKLENGILRGARYVLQEELKILSAQTDRVEERYTVMRKVVATSCQICGNAPPIWQIRANHAVHDREEKQIFFMHAQFRLFGVPVLYLPTLRIPHPSLKRATGFLFPELVTETQLGFGLKVPYFVKLGEHADVTFTPFVSTETGTLEMRFRKMFSKGYVELNGAVSRDTLLPSQLRHYLTGFGVFDLDQDFVLSLKVETASDADYRSAYGYYGKYKDHLGSGITLTRAKRDVFFQAELLNFKTLRDNENNNTQPTSIANLTYERRYTTLQIGGEFRASAEVYGHRGISIANIDGHYMARINLDLSWRDEWTIGNGLRLGLMTSLGFDSHTVQQDSTSVGRLTQVAPALAANLRYPLHGTGADESRYLIEPIAQVAWVDGTPSTITNGENISSEFDENNLLALSRFPTKEPHESGVVGTLGLRWEHSNLDNWSIGIAVGQVFRKTADPAFFANSGLDGLTSDTVLAVNFNSQWGGSFLARGLFDHNFEVTKGEARFSYSKNKLSMSGSYIQLRSDAAESRTTPVEKWSLAGTYRVNRHWTTNADVQYDILTGRTAKTGAKLTYENECISVGLGATRSFAQSTTLVPTTKFELAVSLRGFSTGDSGKAARRTCRK